MQRCSLELRRGVGAPTAVRRPSAPRTRCEAAPAATTEAARRAPTASRSGVLRMRFGVKNIPHPNKAHYGGEDAFFVSEAGNGLAGIADGVGGWQEAGINPADYSKTFMAAARQYLEECNTLVPSVMSTGEWLESQGPGGPPSGDPLAAELAEAAEAAGVKAAPTSSSSNGNGNGSESGAVRAITNALGFGSFDFDFEWGSVIKGRDGEYVRVPPALASTDPSTSPRTAQEALDAAHRSVRVPGSSTACVLRMDAATGLLDAANLGDSGFLIVRDGRLHFQSPAMQHFFDCPLQFGLPPDTDWAQDAEVYSLEVQPGDAIIMATDGLLDNLPVEEIVRLAPRTAEEAEQAAAAMAERASQNSQDPEYESPYTQEALEEGIDIPIWEKLMTSSFKDGKFQLGKLRGGKMDDITVVVAVVVAEEQAAGSAESQGTASAA